MSSIVKQVKGTATRARAVKAESSRLPATTSGNDFPRPYTTVDIVIFTVLDDALQMLLVQRPSESEESASRGLGATRWIREHRP